MANDSDRPQHKHSTSGEISDYEEVAGFEAFVPTNRTTYSAITTEAGPT